MPRTNERRPGVGTEAATCSLTGDTADSTPAGDKFLSPDLERQRMSVLSDETNIVIRGSFVVFETLRRHRMRPIYVGAGLGGWTLDRHKAGRDQLGDVLAILQAAGHRVSVGDLVRPERPRSTLW